MTTSVETFGSLPREALDRFIYIVGMPRGGTSVIRDAIAVHDRVLVLPGMTHFMNQVWRYRKKVHPRLLNQIFRLPGFYQEDRVIQNLAKEEGRALRLHMDQALSSRNLKRMWEIYPIVYALSEENKKKREGILCWADKANDCYGLHAIARHFPRGKFIFIVRDPRGAVSSLAKRAALKEARSSDAIPDAAKIIEACISWRRITQQMLLFRKKHPHRSLVVRFEEFLASPAQSLNGIFQFVLKETLEEETLRERLGRVVYGATNEPAEGGKGIQREPMERWKRMLGEDQVRLIGVLTGKTALMAGYPPMEGRESRQGIGTILRLVPGWKRKARNLAKIVYLDAAERLL